MNTDDLPPIVGVDTLASLAGVVIADVRWYLDGRSGAAVFASGHLPGAVFVDLDADLSEHPGAERGRHPLASPEQFARRLDALGIADGDRVIAYDDTGGGTASRLVVMLRAIGCAAAVLDGGIASYKGALEQGAGASRTPVLRTVVPWPTYLLVDADAATTAGPAVLLDARARERFRGDFEPVDSRPGHIPGARNLPWTELLDPSTGRFLTPEGIGAHFARVGVDAEHPPVASCGSGVTACALLVAHEAAGLGRGALFAASYSGWSADPTRSVEIGD